MDSVSLKACAKINLGLDVIRRRPDGYHEVRMIMQMIDLHDEVSLMRSDQPGIRLRCSRADLPCDESNLAWRAADLMIRSFSLREGVQIEIDKHIPLAAGMAGGSTDCAAVLEGMNTLFGLGLSSVRLRELGVKLGADVPFCLMKGAALAEGIGEILTPLPGLMKTPILIAKPPAGISTGYVYSHLQLEKGLQHPDIDGMALALRNGDSEAVIMRLGNVLETVTIPELPEIAGIKKAMLEAGAGGALMSGSGPTVFGLFTDAGQAAAAENALKEQFPDAAVILTGAVS